MKKKIIIIFVMISIIAIISFINLNKNNNIVSTIVLDINPSIEINLDKNNNIVSVKALNEDAKKIINNDFKNKSLDDVLYSLTINIHDKEYFDYDYVAILLYSEGNVNNEELKEKIEHIISEEGVKAEVIVIENITSEDKKLAKKYNITPSKASYINSILSQNKNIEAKNLVEKSVSDLRETKETGYYCDDGYDLEGSFCVREISQVAATIGRVCPEGYIGYNDKCYKEGNFTEGDNYVCRDDEVLKDGICYLTEKRSATGICSAGEYQYGENKCKELVYIGDATEYCRDPGRTLYEHKCLATKPSINGGCLGNDMYYHGKCLNTKNDYYMSEWKCPNGKTNSRPNGELINDGSKCYDEKITKPTSYVCEDGFELKDDECIRVETRRAGKELICKDGSTLVDNTMCIYKNDTKDYEEGYICEARNSRLKGNICIIREEVLAKR